MRFTPVEGADIEIAEMPDGMHGVEFWDTYGGQVTRTTEARASAGMLRVPLPTIERDLELKIIALNHG